MVQEGKPRGSPLTRHPNGQWCKRINGKLHYFGKDHAEAVRLYRQLATDLHAGRAVADTDPLTITVAQLCNRFLADRMRRRDADELTAKQVADYHRACKRLTAVLGVKARVGGVRPDDLGRLRHALSEDLAPSSVATMVRMVRTMFKWGWDNALLDRPVRYGSSFDAPPPAAIRKQRAGAVRTFTADDVSRLIDNADGPVKAFVLLGINCGFGSTDIATLRSDCIAGGFVTHPRPKTGIARRCALWPQTIDAVNDAANGDDPLFVTAQGNRWVRNEPVVKNGVVVRTVNIDSVALLFGRLRKELGIKSPGFYGLRRTFRTVADECGDQHAVHLAMGHVVTGMAGVYVDRISDDRLRAVADHVQAWLKMR